jgi:hypothetical protein
MLALPLRASPRNRIWQYKSMILEVSSRRHVHGMALVEVAYALTAPFIHTLNDRLVIGLAQPKL